MLRFAPILLAFLALSAHAENRPCPASREYITALEFLRSSSSLKLPEPEARKYADEIAKGCAGAAERFIRVSAMLSRAGLSGREAAETGKRFAIGTPAEVDTFVTVFKRAFAEEYLDLDLGDSLRMALSLAKEFAGDQPQVRADFEKLLAFCTEEKNLGLPKPQCGAFASRIAAKGETWNGGVAGPFIRGFEYLTSSHGPSLVSGEALKVSETLLAAGPGAFENFTQAYGYAVAEGGLHLGREDAIKFARGLALTRDAHETTPEKPAAKK
ncbi:MAG: hypothetical protein JST04_04950 [Bdellovibrionales bacterium]|nr:hypothetical protein [Bdellovibrionales bacterium]